MNSSYLLSKDLKGYLANYGITYLELGQHLYGHPEGLNGWYSTSNLELGGYWADQWTAYIKGLADGGIRIGNLEDSLLWLYDKNLGMVTSKKNYELIVVEHMPLRTDSLMPLI